MRRPRPHFSLTCETSAFGRKTTRSESRKFSNHVPSQTMALSDMSARVRVNMKRSPLESEDGRVLEDPGEDEVMIGEIQVNEAVEHPRSEVSATELDDWQQKGYEGILRELQSQNDFISIHEVPSSEAANKEVIKTRVVLKPFGEGVKARYVMKHWNTWKDENNDFFAGTPTPVSFNLVWAVAAKRVALGKSQTIACLVLSPAFLHAEMKDEVYIEMDADTLHMIRDENLPNFQPSDDESFYNIDKESLARISRFTTTLEGRRGRGSERS